MCTRNILKSDFRRIISSPMIYISYFLGLAILLRPLIPGILDGFDGSFMQAISIPFGLSDFTPFAAIFCVLPFADSFCNDYNTGYANQISTRTGTKRYAIHRSITVSLSGGILMAALFATVIVVCAILANQPETTETANFAAQTIWGRMNLILRYNGVVMALLRILLAFLFGCLWAQIGLAISVFVTNRYVTYIAPFVVYEIAWFLLANTAVNPVYLLRGDAQVIPSLWFAIGWQTLLIAIFSAVSYVGMRKKVLV